MFMISKYLKKIHRKNCSVRHKICVTIVSSSLILKANLIYTQYTHLSPRQTNISVVVEVKPSGLSRSRKLAISICGYSNLCIVNNFTFLFFVKKFKFETENIMK